MTGRTIHDVQVGDKIIVHGQMFVLTDFHTELDQPAYVIFKQPTELEKEKKDGFETVGGTKLVASGDQIELASPYKIHLLRGSGDNVKAECGTVYPNFGTYFGGLATCPRCRVAVSTASMPCGGRA